MTAPYRLIASIHNNRLWRALRAWAPDCTTQRALAARLGINVSTLSALLTMRRWPCGIHGWYKEARVIADAVGEPIESLFDPVLYGKRPNQRIALEIEAPLPIDRTMVVLPPQAAQAEAEEIRERLRAQLALLSPMQQRALTLRFGLDGASDDLTYEEVGRAMKRTGSRAQQLVASGLRKLRHPSSSIALRDYDPNPDAGPPSWRFWH